MTAPLDVVVVGAGAAGITATRTLRERGRSVTLVEAKDRPGGRAWTETSSLGVPFDRGCAWLHSADVNPLTRLAHEYGFTVDRSDRPVVAWLGDRWATDEENEERESFFANAFDEAERLGEEGRDVPIRDVFDADHRWGRMFGQWIAMISGVDPEECSTLDDATFADTGRNWPIREGYGALVARYGAGLPIELRTRVERIEWGDSGGVRVRTNRGLLEARAVVVTVSVGVLAAGTIRFDPPLPDWKQAAIDSVRMGRANKIAFAFDEDVFGLPEGSFVALDRPPPETIGFQIRPFGWNVAVGYVGGRFAGDLERRGESSMRDYALECLRSVFGSSVDGHVRSFTCTAWQSDPECLGAYSGARPGEATARGDLARNVSGRLFFAGEATSSAAFGTTHGAYESGRVAAAEVDRELSRPHRTGS